MAVGDALRRSPRLISNLYVGVLVAVYAVIGILVAPALYSDSGWGFLVSDSMEKGGPFNHLLEPDAPEIAFELPQMRVIPTGEAPEDLTGQSCNGRVGKLFIPGACNHGGRRQGRHHVAGFQ